MHGTPEKMSLPFKMGEKPLYADLSAYFETTPAIALPSH